MCIHIDDQQEGVDAAADVACQTWQVPVEYTTQLSSSMPPLTPKSPKTPESFSAGTGEQAQSAKGASGGPPPQGVAQGDRSSGRREAP